MESLVISRVFVDFEYASSLTFRKGFGNSSSGYKDTVNKQIKRKCQ